MKTANCPPLSGALGFVFVYINSSPLSLLRMHNYDFIFALLHTTHFSIITLNTQYNALPNLWLLLVLSANCLLISMRDEKAGKIQWKTWLKQVPCPSSPMRVYIIIACSSVSYYNLSMALVSPSYPEYSLEIWPHDISQVTFEILHCIR